MEKDEIPNFADTEKIYSDYVIIKQQIWFSWYSFLENLGNLLMALPTKQYDIVSYSAAIKHLSMTHDKIGEVNLQKHLDPIDYDALEDIYKKICEGENLIKKKNLGGEFIDLKKLLTAKEIIVRFLHKSGIGDINTVVQSNSRSVSTR